MPDDIQLGTIDTTIAAKVIPMQPLVIHQLTAEQIDALRGASFGKTLSSVLTGVLSSAAITLWITIKTVDIADPIKTAIFYAFAYVSTLGTVISAVIWFRAEYVSAGLAKRLKYELPSASARK